MPPARLSLFTLLLALATSVSAQDAPGSEAAADVFSQGLDQAVYKGLVGNVLDAIPMDPSKRLDLQRTNAVIGNTLLGRTLTVLAGLSNPILLIGGFVWGVWAAANIKPAEAGMNLAADPGQSGGVAASQERVLALSDRTSGAEVEVASTVSGTIVVSSISTADADGAARSHPRVIKIWPPQHSPMLPR